MIRSFRDEVTAELFRGERHRSVPPDVAKTAGRKLQRINAVTQLSDLAAPPGNRLEPLDGDLVGYHSIRVNDQWRIVFRWKSDGAHEVWFTDYH